MAKYDALFRHLCTLDDDTPVEMTFDEVQQLVGPLPRAAAQRDWWSNDQTARRPSHTRAWLDAGRQVEHLDRANRRVRFGPARWRRSS
jgi:hypothetical protein